MANVFKAALDAQYPIKGPTGTIARLDKVLLLQLAWMHMKMQRESYKIKLVAVVLPDR
jgi:hypothetical protein